MSIRRIDHEAGIASVQGAAEIRVVGMIPDRVLDQLGVVTAARGAWLHPDILHHIRQQRIARRTGLETGDAEFTLAHLPNAILSPDYCGLDLRDARRRRIDLVHAVRGTGRWLYTCVKVVEAAESKGGTDELWVCTAHPLGERFLTQRRYRDSLHSVRW